MKNRMHAWALFVIFAAAVVGGMGWISVRLCEVTRENDAARRREWIEGEIRNALWRMDAEMSSVVLEEASRPYVDYWAFNGPGVVVDEPTLDQMEQLKPSPLLATNPSTMNLYFQADLGSEGQQSVITSPQVISSDALANTLNWSRDIQAGNAQRLATLNDNVTVSDLQGAVAQAEEREQQQDEELLVAQHAMVEQSQAIEPAEKQLTQQQGEWSVDEYSQRRQQPNRVLSKIKQSKERIYNYGVGKSAASTSASVRKSEIRNEVLGTDDVFPAVVEEAMRPVWVKDFLILARKVDIGGAETIQGVWLSWEHIREQLLQHVIGVFPDAELVKADPIREPDKSRMLASLPVKLVPGDPITVGIPAAAALRTPLTAAWVAVVTGILAVGALIAGTSALSERRAAFVSAVTHELRTPLTTFRMYTEILKDGIVSDEKGRQEYLSTLHAESERLGHLVENVLAYARLEKGVGRRTLEDMTVGDLVARACDSLQRRADEGAMRLVPDIQVAAGETVIRSDATAVQQILFNLVDNACKYAVDATDQRIHLAVSKVNGFVLFKVSDHGSGLKPREVRAVFRPFRKSAEKAAGTAPGVGLGLALSRRLARQLGGRLTYETHREYGACFCLSLPTR